MTSPATHALIETPFRVDSVTRIATPEGGSGDWWRYVLSQSSKPATAITGERGGSRLEIDADLAVIVNQLNERLGKPYRKKLYRTDRARRCPSDE